MSVSSSESLEDCNSLRKCNKLIKVLCDEINELVDIDFDLAQKANELERLSAIKLSYAKAANEYRIELMQFRDRHLNTAVNYQNKPGKAIKSLGRLYNQLKKQNISPAESSNTSVASKSVQQWGIPLLSKLPRPNVPKDLAGQSSFSLNLSRSLFKGRQHYYFYNHLRLSHAKSHLHTLQQTLVVQRAQHEDRQVRADLLEKHLSVTKDEIAKYKEELSSDKSLAVWQESYELYRDIVREFLEMIASSGKEISCENEPDLFEVESPPAVSKSRLRFGLSRSNTSLVPPKLHKSPANSIKSIKSMVTTQSRIAERPNRNSEMLAESHREIIAGSNPTDGLASTISTPLAVS